MTQEEGTTWRRRAVAQRHRQWSMNAYILKDDGASENFVSRKYLKKLEEKGARVETKNKGWMTVRTARSQTDPPLKERRQRAKLEVNIGLSGYTYTEWFTVFDIDTYDVVLGKRWVRDINLQHTIDHVQNTMNIWDSADAMSEGKPPHRLIGLRPGITPRRREREKIKEQAALEQVDLCWMEDLLTETQDLNNTEVSPDGNKIPKKHITTHKRSVRRRLMRKFKNSFVLYVRILEGDASSAEGEWEAEETEEQLMNIKVQGITENSERGNMGFLEEFADVFTPRQGQKPPPTREKFRIVLEEGHKAPYRSPYRLSKAEETELEDQVKTALQRGWIVPSDSEYGAPVLFVPKKDGGVRMCIDYRPLNAITRKDRFPIPSIEDLMDKLQGARRFSKLDLADGYHQMEITPKDQHKTAFATKFGLYEWKVLPFGLTNGPSVFMRMMTRIFNKNPAMKKYVVVYLDDILIFSKSEAEHEEHVRSILQLLREEELILKPSKCIFNQEAVEFVGYWVDEEGVHTAEQKIKAVLDWPRPECGKEVLGFLGLTGYYRKFIEKYAHLALPLYSICQVKRKHFDSVWTKDCEKAFIALKQRLASSPVLALPAENGDWIIRSDASKEALGAVLIQRQYSEGAEPEERVLAYWSRKLTGAETRYPTYDRELLAIREAILQWRFYLHGTPFTVYTDHAALQRILSQRTLSTRQITYLEVLQCYDFKIKYWPGARNTIADALSRRPDYIRGTGSDTEKNGEEEERKKKTTEELEDVAEWRITEMSVESGADWVQGVRTGYEKDETFRLIKQACILRTKAKDQIEIRRLMAREVAREKERKGMKPEEVLEQGGEIAREARRWIQAADRYRLEDGLLYRLDEKDEEGRGKEEGRTLCIPRGESVRVALFREAHDSLTGGHFGVDRTYSTLRQRFYWPRMRASIKSYVKSCDTCHRVKASNKRPMGLLMPLAIPNERWERIGIDFIVKLPESRRGNDTICSIIDHTTRRAHFFAMREATTAEEFAPMFIENHFRLHGMPKRIVSDRDQRFLSEFWKAFMNRLKTELSPSTPFHPQTDGATEKVNQIVSTYLKAFATQFADSWDDILPLAEFSYNASKHKAIGETPFYADIGYTPTLPLDTVASVKATETMSARGLHGDEFGQRLKAILQTSRISLQNTQDQQTASANEKRRPTTVRAGDSVFLSTKRLPHTYANVSDESTKLRHLYAGPFTITKMVNDNAARLDIPRGLDISKSQNVSYLKEDNTGGNRGSAPQPPLRRVRGQEEGIYEVEKVVEHVGSGTNMKNTKYRVRYVNYSEAEDEWLSLKELEGAKEIVEAYHVIRGLQPPEWKKKKKKKGNKNRTDKQENQKSLQEKERRRSTRKRKKTSKWEPG